VHVYSHNSALKLEQIIKPLESAENQNQINTLPVYERSDIALDQEIHGPGLIIETVATTYLEAGWSCKTDQYGHLHLHKNHAN